MPEPFLKAQVFPCKLWKISKNIFSYRTPLVAASVKPSINQKGRRNESTDIHLLHFSRQYKANKSQCIKVKVLILAECLDCESSRHKHS